MARKVERKNYGWLNRVIYVVYLLYCRLRFGPNVRLIPLSRFMFAIVDKEDYAYLSKFNWHPHCSYDVWYAARRTWIADKKKAKRIFMHRAILNAPPDRLVDHKNHHTFDNRRSNLRLATNAENCCNRKKRKSSSSSKYKGVGLYKPPKYRRKHWHAHIDVNRRRIHLGTFPTEIEAAKAYDTAAKKFHGEFACLNFPKRSEGPKGVLLRICKPGTHLFTKCNVILRSPLARLRNLPGLLAGLLQKIVASLNNLSTKLIRRLLNFTANRRV